MVSLHTLSELSQKKDQALALAESLPKLSHYPIGTFAEQIATIADVKGTFDDARRNNLIQHGLKNLANAGTDIHDRGGYIDALANRLDGFITSDRQLCSDGPKGRINSTFHTKVLTPKELAFQLDLMDHKK